MKFKKGDTAHIFNGPGKPYKIHILAIIEERQVVFRWYGRHKQWWHYQIEHKDVLQSRIKLAQSRKVF